MARLLCAGFACLLGIGIPTLRLVPSSPEAQKKAAGRTLTFAERIAYQRAIEEIYWRHRIWPKVNPRPKPPLGAVISQAQLKNKVEDYLRKSELVADQRGFPITASDLQTEMDRMAANTKQPQVLRELFAVLGNDAFAVAECLARPALAERLSVNVTFVAGVPLAGRNCFAVSTDASTENRIRATANMEHAEYKLPKISTPLGCGDDTWTAITHMKAPDARANHTALWTGSEMIVWGGYNTNGGQLDTLNTGGRYDPATDNWIATSTISAPTGRNFHSAVWTGAEMIVWGGYNYPAGDLNSGGRYNPAADSWTATNAVSAPEGRESHTAVWTGSEMIVWGGAGCTFGNCLLNTGGTYNPSTDTWLATSTANAPVRRFAHTAVWSGSEMTVWGGSDRTNYLHTGARYDPNTDTWMPTGVANAPPGRIAHTAVWTGDDMIVWGGVDETFNDTNTGGRYNPTEDSWMPTSTMNAPSARDSHTAVWTGSEMIIWGGVFCCPAMDFNTGGRYGVGNDSWIATSTADAPLARWAHTAVWTGREMIVWGGYNDPGNVFLNTGARYCAQSGATPTPTPRTAPTPRSRPTPHPRS